MFGVTYVDSDDVTLLNARQCIDIFLLPQLGNFLKLFDCEKVILNSTSFGDLRCKYVQIVTSYTVIICAISETFAQPPPAGLGGAPFSGPPPLSVPPPGELCLTSCI